MHLVVAATDTDLDADWILQDLKPGIGNLIHLADYTTADFNLDNSNHCYLGYISSGHTVVNLRNIDLTVSIGLANTHHC
jgi:hypothetical protein